jgi:hypothetical protein
MTGSPATHASNGGSGGDVAPRPERFTGQVTMLPDPQVEAGEQSWKARLLEGFTDYPNLRMAISRVNVESSAS